MSSEMINISSGLMSLFNPSVENYLKPIQYNQVKVGKYLMIKGHPCKITKALISKPGKHGSTKLNVTGLCQHCDKKFNMAGLPGHSSGVCPVIEKFELTVRRSNMIWSE
jgi:hypothetical protein